jgi:hypothetical protein
MSLIKMSTYVMASLADLLWHIICRKNTENSGFNLLELEMKRGIQKVPI